MAIMLDADVIIRGEKGSFDLAQWVASNPEEQFELAAITVAELWHGVERAVGAVRARRLEFLEAVVAALPVIAYTQATAYEHARIWAELQSAGKMVGFYDIIVAATALERDSELATFNKRHFAGIKGLKIVVPT